MITERLPALDDIWEDGIEPEDDPGELPSIIVDLDRAA